MDVAWARAVLARLIAELFSDPDADGDRRLSDPCVRNELTAAAEILGMIPGSVDALTRDLPSVADRVEERNRMLGHTVRAACPPYELEYGNGEVFQQSQSLADIAGFYAAFGFETAGPLAERVDHFVGQWEFLSVVSLREFAAPTASTADACRSAQESFLREHAAAWMPAFFTRLRRADPNSFLARAAAIAESLLNEWCAARHVTVGPSWMELRPVCDEDTSINCGASDVAPVELGPSLAAAMVQRG